VHADRRVLAFRAEQGVHRGRPRCSSRCESRCRPVSVTVLARVEDQARPFRVRPAKESSAASLDPLTLIVQLSSDAGDGERFCSSIEEQLSAVVRGRAHAGCPQ
jgi:hypothetical protein